MSFQNVYFKRAVGTAKPCYICLKQTTTVLATVDVVDFLYTCDTHLTDPGFATLVPTEPSKPQVSAEEIEKIKKEYEEKQKEKKEKEEAKKKEAEKDKEKDDKGDQAATSPKNPKSPAPTPTPPAPATPSRQKYVLHRQIFQMRLDEHKKRRQAREVTEVAPKFPIAPRSNVN